jgi:hypothetical protein
VTEFAMIRNLGGRKLVLVRFHNADHIVVSENGVQRVLAAAIWASLPLWTKPPIETPDVQENPKHQ